VDLFAVGHRQYSNDLPQDGMEVPCDLQFEGPRVGKVMLDSFCGENALLQDYATSSGTISRHNPNTSIQNQAVVPASSIIFTDLTHQRRKDQD